MQQLKDSIVGLLLSGSNSDIEEKEEVKKRKVWAMVNVGVKNALEILVGSTRICHFCGCGRREIQIH